MKVVLVYIHMIKVGFLNWWMRTTMTSGATFYLFRMILTNNIESEFDNDGM